MSLQMGIYVPSSVILTMDGVALTGLAEDGGISNKLTTKQATVKQGQDGFISGTQIVGGVPGELTLKFAQNSLANTYLTAALAAQLLGVFHAFSVIDLSTGTSVSYPRGFITGAPDVEFGKESGDREWMITGACIVQAEGAVI